MAETLLLFILVALVIAVIHLTRLHHQLIQFIDRLAEMVGEALDQNERN